MFIGDRLDTDILFGKASGMYSLLVMTGVTSAKKMIELEAGSVDEPLPTAIIPHIGLLRI